WTGGVVLGPVLPSSYDAGAQSFLYSEGRMSRIDPVDGPANAINDSGQVAGGHFSSINDNGQYVGSSGGGVIYQGQFSLQSQLVSDGQIISPLPIDARSINNSGTIVGLISASGSNLHAAILQNGQVTDLSKQFGLRGSSDDATAISQSGYILV